MTKKDKDYVQKQVNENRLWEEFKNDLIYSNRFFPKERIEDAFLNRIDAIISLSQSTVRKGSYWYRAREYFIESPTILSNKELSIMSDKEKKKEKKRNDNLFFEKNLINTAKAIKTFEEISMDYSDNLSYIKNLIKSINNFAEKEKTSIWGYSEKDSGIAPSEKAGLNRASPKYISYLYLAKNCNTALADEAGNRISNENIIIAESTSKKPEERTYMEKFTLKDMAYDKGKNYYLVLKDEDELVNTELERIPFIIDLVFGGSIRF